MHIKSTLRFIAALALLSLTGCGPTLTYAPDQSASNMPSPSDRIMVEPAIEGEMMSGDDFTEDPQRSASYLADISGFSKVIDDTTVKTLKDAGFNAGAGAKTKGGFVIKPRFYYLPYNPLTGGHFNVFLRIYNAKGQLVATSGSGRDFGGINIMVNAGVDGILAGVARQATLHLIRDLPQKSLDE